MTVIKSGGEQSHQFVTVLHFSTYEKVGEWEGSDVRKDLRAEVARLEEGKASFREVTGFEYWFSLPRIAATRPPARYKMMLVTVLGLYMLSVTYTYTINVWLKSLPDHLGIIIRILVLVLVMTYAVMPLLSRLFARWLYPRSARSGAGEPG
jgi:antibiotic biosynthesis monooxygenase (ABM) superfamily enzyme